MTAAADDDGLVPVPERYFDGVDRAIVEQTATAERHAVRGRRDGLGSAPEPVLVPALVGRRLEWSEQDEQRAVGEVIGLDDAIGRDAALVGMDHDLAKASPAAAPLTMEDDQAIRAREAVGMLAQPAQRLTSRRLVADRDTDPEVQRRPGRRFTLWLRCSRQRR